MIRAILGAWRADAQPGRARALPLPVPAPVMPRMRRDVVSRGLPGFAARALRGVAPGLAAHALSGALRGNPARAARGAPLGIAARILTGNPARNLRRALGTKPARILPGILAGGLAASAAGAVDFTRETWCEGEIVFPNDDGTAGLYDMKLWFHDGAFSVVARDLSTGEVIEGSGACDLGRERICKHVIPGDAVSPDDAYAFMLQPMDGGMYLYKEVWLDGSQGRGLVACYGAL